MIDEADLTYHPEWQRQFISILTAFLPKVYQAPLQMQVVLSTHSPIILSDIPKENIMYLEEGHEKETFGQNIHTIFADSFTLKKTSTIGQFASKKIKAASDFFDPQKPDNTGADLNIEQVKAIIDIIGEELVKRNLISKYNNHMTGTRVIPQNSPVVKEYQKLSDDEKKDFIRFIIENSQSEKEDKND